MSKGLTVLLFIGGIVLLVAASVTFERPSIEADLEYRTQQTLTDGDFAAVSVAFTGRDGVLSGTVPSEAARDDALNRARSVWGVRIVDDGLAVSSPAPAPSPPDVLPAKVLPATATLQARLDEVLAQSSIRFATGSARLTADDRRTLDTLHAVLLGADAVTLEVQGHTDHVGSRRRNQALSQQRADAVHSYLMRRGLPSGVNMTSVGYGETQPISTNITPEGRRLNRRVALVVQ
ncbi:MAG: hypothetical protein RhofKO_11750 [Rhodothermales bacterium]